MALGPFRLWREFRVVARRLRERTTGFIGTLPLVGRRVRERVILPRLVAEYRALYPETRVWRKTIWTYSPLTIPVEQFMPARNQWLTGRATVIGPDGRIFTVEYPLPTGTPYDPDRSYLRLVAEVAEKAKDQKAPLKDPSAYVRNSIIHIDWYVTTLKPRG